MERVFAKKLEKELEKLLSSRPNGVAHFMAAAKNLKIDVRVEKSKSVKQVEYL